MTYFGCSVRKITSVLIRPGSVVRVHNGPFYSDPTPESERLRFIAAHLLSLVPNRYASLKTIEVLINAS